MSNINLFQVLIARFLQKSFTASKKLYFPTIIKRLFFTIHHKYMKHLLVPYFKVALRYINHTNTFRGHNNSNIIWMFWWQGYQNMPLLVKRCVQSVKYFSNGYKVILITKYNVKQYAKLSHVIYKKVYDNELDFTHFSDILRFNLLDLYGGLWIDSTIYCTSNITSKYFRYIYTTGGYKNTVPPFVKGRWSEFLIGGNSRNNALRFVDKFLQVYFSKNINLPSYFLADYALNYSYNKNLGDFKYYVNVVAKGDNPNLFKLVNLLNKPYNSNKIKEITKNTNLFKLTYKKTFTNRNDTFYNKIIKNEF